MKAEIRCGQPHPEVPHWVCRAPLNIEVPANFEIRAAAPRDPRCVTVTCYRCGTTYEVCPIERVA